MLITTTKLPSVQRCLCLCAGMCAWAAEFDLINAYSCYL